MPVIAPPLKATSSAGAMPPRAASAVRTLARTDTFMPMKPAAPESTAPIRKPMAVSQPSFGTNPMTRKRMMPTMAMVLYCRLRYASAPSWMALAISCMRSLPAGNARICRLEIQPYRTANTAQPSASNNAVLIIPPPWLTKNQMMNVPSFLGTAMFFKRT
jgi:hypothetical protein